jgi:signal transduction histidine kinase/CheY-like chemotaxis protein
MAPEDRAGARAALEGTAASGGKTATFEFRLPRRHGPVRRFEARAATFADRRGVPARMIGVTVDVTERRAAADALARINEELEARVRERTAALEAEAAKRAQAEARLQQAQKMEALGQLTGGIAHDFNNVLSAIANNIELARRDGDPVRQRHHMASALTAVESGAKLVRQLLVFARKHPVNVHPVAVNEVIGGMASMLRRTCSEEIEFEFRLDDRVGWVNADPYQLQTVLLNLVVNARDAMPEGGSIAIETGLAAREPAGGGEYVCVAVADTGTGMTPEVLRQAFEPFFTTKEIGKGTGLGLSMVLGAMRQIGGDVTIDSAPGRGTTVRLYFPCAAAPSAEGAGAEPAGGGESSGAAIPVLFVEDDLLINVSTAELLEGAGYVVHAAARADQALALLDAHPEIRLLITDIGLPQVSGRALADEARRRRPGLKVLFVTGYDRTGLGEAVPPDPAVAYLAKPYQTAELFAAIKRLRQARCEGTGGGASEAG